MPYFEDFPAVEALQAASEAAGWQCEYRQIEAGQLQARTVFQPLGTSSLVCETANRRLDISARTPRTAITVMVPLPGTSVLINGKRLTDDRLMILPPNIDFHASSTAGDEVWSVHISDDLIGDETGEPLDSRSISGQSIALERARMLIRETLREGRGSALLELEARAADLCYELLQSDSSETDSCRFRHRRKALQRAVAYMEEHMSRPIRMGQVCAYAGVSLSTLERLFRSEFQQAPTQYLRARRLDLLRRKLRSSDAAGRTIAEIALECGLTHMGRLSSAYRMQFGILPSTDLR